VLTVGLWGAITALAGSSKRTAHDCIAYTRTNVPPSTQCMNLPWLMEEVGPGSRWVLITVAPGCFSTASGEARRPTAVVHETRSAIRIRVFDQHPVLHHGRLGSCGRWSLSVHLRAPIDGRRIEGQSWPSRPHYGSLRGRLIGLPRLLGLAPAQALHVLWLGGFHADLTGKGRQVVAQAPGWGLIDPRARSQTGSVRPDPFDGVASLQAGSHIAIPTAPLLKLGTPSGLLIGTVSPDTARIEPIALFDARGRLLARLRVPGRHPFRLRLAPGTYSLLADSELWISCGPGRVRVRSGRIAYVTVPLACNIP
jgi:hypothetical protein